MSLAIARRWTARSCVAALSSSDCAVVIANGALALNALAARTDPEWMQDVIVAARQRSHELKLTLLSTDPHRDSGRHFRN